jgi:hypothetical protein
LIGIGAAKMSRALELPLSHLRKTPSAPGGSECTGSTNLSFPWSGFYFFSIGRSKAVNTKTTQRLESAASRILRAFIFLIAIVLLSTTRIPLPWLYLQLWPVGFWPFWLGAAVTIAGLLFAVWAREHLGRNWSRSVTIKQGRELITTSSSSRSGSSSAWRNSGCVPSSATRMTAMLIRRLPCVTISAPLRAS